MSSEIPENKNEAERNTEAPEGLLLNKVGQRLHATSLIFDIVSHSRKYLVPAALGVFGAASGNYFWTIFAAMIFIPEVAVAVFRFFTLRYRIFEEQLVVTSGLIFRKTTTVPLARIQNVDLVQNVLHRLFNVAEVRVETASGSKPEAILRVLSMAEVAKLRDNIFDKRTSKSKLEPGLTVSADVGDVIPHELAPADEILLQIPWQWLVKAGLASNRGLLIVGIFIGLFYQFDFDEQIVFDQLKQQIPTTFDSTLVVVMTAIAAIVFFLLLRLFGVAWYLLRFYGYRLTQVGQDLRISCGLLTRVSATLPRGRIQFISIHKTLFMRWMGLATIRIETAGGAGKSNEDATTTVARRWFVPVVPDDRVSSLLAKLRPGLDWNPDELNWKPLAKRAGRRLIRIASLQCILIAAAGLAVTHPWGFLAGVALLPVLIGWAIKKSRSMRYARTDATVIYRSGVLNRKTSMTFFDRIQTLRIDQSPFDRRWQMARLSVDTAAAGPAEHRISVPFLEETFAHQEFEQLADRAASELG